MNEDIKFIIGSVITVLLSTFFSVWITRRNLKSTIYVDKITTQRINFLDAIREEYSFAHSEIDLICVKGCKLLNTLSERELYMGTFLLNRDTDLHYEKLTNKASELQSEVYNQDRVLSILKNLNKLILRLNYKDDIEIIRLFMRQKEILELDSYGELEYDELLKLNNESFEHIQLILKCEWEKVKEESTKK